MSNQIAQKPKEMGPKKFRLSDASANRRKIMGKVLYFCPTKGCENEDHGLESRSEFISHVHKYHQQSIDKEQTTLEDKK